MAPKPECLGGFSRRGAGLRDDLQKAICPLRHLPGRCALHQHRHSRGGSRGSGGQRGGTLAQASFTAAGETKITSSPFESGESKREGREKGKKKKGKKEDSMQAFCLLTPSYTLGWKSVTCLSITCPSRYQ